MDRRSWPWKKKSSSSKHSPESTLSPAALSSKSEQDNHVKSYVEQLQVVTQRCQQAEDTIKGLNFKLEAAQKDITEKENLVKQHTKVAEDAVSGWEKAENETANIKQELEVTLEQKAELEEQVAYLDETLKEATQNQKKTKEEYERKIQEITARKTKECERLRHDFETRLSEVGQRLLESTAENKVLTSTLQERLRKISELSDARSRAEAEIGMLTVRLEDKDKDIMSLRYEVQVNNKELQVRNEEKDYCKREAEVAHRQQQESIRKIQVLEAETQRLRTLVRRKLPGPAAVAQMKHEADSWGREERRRSLGSNNGSRFSSGDRKDIEIQLLMDRVLSMEEETKMLREALTQRNSELQATRSIYSETAASSAARKSKPGGAANSEYSFNEDAGSCADAWSSAVSELDHFKKERVGGGGSPGILVDDSKFQMMDDFVEMEQLASTSVAEQKSSTEVPEVSSDGGNAPNSSSDDLLADKDKELQAANRLCVEISSKLIETEKEFAALKEKNAANEKSLIKLQERIDTMLEEKSEENSDKFQKVSAPTAALSANVHKVMGLVEALAHAIGVEHEDNTPLPSPSSSEVSSSEHSQVSTWQHSSGFEKLTTVSNKLVEGKVDFTDYIGELSSVLNVMTMSISSDNGSEQGRKPASNLRRELTYGIKESETTTSLEKQNGVLQAEITKLRQEMSRLKTEKDMLHQSYENANDRIQEIQSQLEKAELLVTDLKAKLASSQKELSSVRSQHEDRIKASESVVVKLREKLTIVEGQYDVEREQHTKLAARYQELETQINERQQRSSTSMEANVGAGVEASSKNGLAECQRTILALGKQQFTSPTAEATSHSREISITSSLDNKPYSEEDDLGLLQSSTNLGDNFGWSGPRIQGFDHPALSWSPPRNSQNPQHKQLQLENEDGSWLYSPDRTIVSSRSVQRSPGRFLSARKDAQTSSGINDLSKSVNIGKNFGRFFSRGRNV